MTNTTRHLTGASQAGPAAATRASINPFEGAAEPANQLPSGPVDFAAIQCSDDFVRLRARLLRFIFPMTAAFLGWYLCYVLLAAYARSFMSFQLVGEINVGLVLGLLQFVSTVVITVWYARFARKNVDPDVRRIRAMANGHVE